MPFTPIKRSLLDVVFDFEVDIHLPSPPLLPLLIFLLSDLILSLFSSLPTGTAELSN